MTRTARTYPNSKKKVLNATLLMLKDTKTEYNKENNTDSIYADITINGCCYSFLIRFVEKENSCRVSYQLTHVEGSATMDEESKAILYIADLVEIHLLSDSASDKFAPETRARSISEWLLPIRTSLLRCFRQLLREYYPVNMLPADK